MNSFDVFSIDLKQSCFIEASAGTGKTHALIHLVLRFLLEAEMDVDKICVVTFTVAAARELKTRLQENLLSLQHFFDSSHFKNLEPQKQHTTNTSVDMHWISQYQNLTSTEKEKWKQIIKQALSDFDGATITTLHGFANQLLDQFSFETSLSLDSWRLGEEEPWIRKATEDFWRKTFYQQIDTDFIQHLMDPEKGIHQQSINIDMLETFVKEILMREQEIVPSREALLEQLQQIHDPNEAFYETKARLLLHDLVDYVKQRLIEIKNKARFRSFDDLVSLLIQRIDRFTAEEKEAFCSQINKQYKVALIDEFQDTDHRQYHLFSQLFNQNNLFLIGDPKQSIYSFRGTNIHTYLRAKKTFFKQNQIYHMDINWRSDPLLIEAINRLFANSPFYNFSSMRSFASADIKENKIKYHPLQAAPKKSHEVYAVNGKQVKKPIQCWMLSINGKKSCGKNVAREMFADATAIHICELLHPTTGATINGKPLQASDITILCPTSYEINLMIDVLQSYNLPYQKNRKENVYNSEEMHDLYHLLSAIHEPHRHSFVRATLMGPFWGEAMSPTVPMTTSSHPPLPIEEAESRFRAYKKIWEQKGVAAAIKQCERENNFVINMLKKPDGNQRASIYLHLTQTLIEMDAMQKYTPLMLLKAMERMMQSNQTEGIESLELSSSQLHILGNNEAIQLTTIHSSKGLEYPVVYCPFAWNESSHKKKELYAWMPQQDSDRFCADISGQSSQYKSIQEDELKAEKMRLLYVCFTRAKHHLIIGYGNINGVKDHALYNLFRSLGVEEYNNISVLQKDLKQKNPYIDVIPLPQKTSFPHRKHPPQNLSHKPHLHHLPLHIKELPLSMEIKRDYTISSFSSTSSNPNPTEDQQETTFASTVPLPTASATTP